MQAKHVWLCFHSAPLNANLKLLLNSEDDLKSTMLSGHPILNTVDLAKSAVTFASTHNGVVKIVPLAE